MTGTPRMRRAPRSLAAIVAAVLAAGLLASCGGGGAKLLPGATAQDITANLNTVKQLTDEGDCVGAESAARQVDEQVELLTGVDAKLKSALEQGAARLNEVVARCEETITETVTPMVPTEPETVPEKPKKEPKEKKTEEEAVTPPEEVEEEAGPELPPQANGKAKGHEPAPEEGPASGGVSPNAAVGEEG